MAMFTTRTFEDDRLEFNIDNGLDQDLLRYCNEICQESCGADFDPACGDCHVTRLYYAMLRLAEYEDIGLTPKEVADLKTQLTEVKRRGKAAEEELDHAQPCFACAGFRRNGGKCFGTVLKYPGSKWSTADWIISNFPAGYEKMTYLEPFFGSGAVFFNKKRSLVETINDLDGNVINLFKQIRDNTEALARAIEYTPWSREEYSLSYQKTGNDLEDARRFLVRMWQAIGAKSSDITGWRSNIKSINGNVTQWATVLPKNIMHISSRLKHSNNRLVQIENQPAAKLIKRYARANVFIYADPPYVLRTRSKRIYACEMKDADHVELLQLLLEHPGPVMISGYANDIYADMLKDWQIQTRIANCEGGLKRQEVIWMNYEPAVKQIDMFYCTQC